MDILLPRDKCIKSLHRILKPKLFQNTVDTGELAVNLFDPPPKRATEFSPLTQILFPLLLTSNYTTAMSGEVGIFAFWREMFWERDTWSFWDKNAQELVKTM